MIQQDLDNFWVDHEGECHVVLKILGLREDEEPLFDFVEVDGSSRH